MPRNARVCELCGIGSAWCALGTGIDGFVFALTTLPNGDLIAGGDFTIAGGETANGIARYDPATGVWTALDTSMNGTVFTVTTLPNGDVDGDNEVTILDYLALSTAFGATSSDANWNAIDPASGVAPSASDLNGDVQVSILDYVILSKNYEKAGDQP